MAEKWPRESSTRALTGQVWEGYRFFEGLLGNKGHLGGPGMALQVIAGAVGTPYDFNPALSQNKSYS